MTSCREKIVTHTFSAKEMAYRKILSPKQTVPLSGNWFAWAEALNASGITDPYELYKYMHHPSDVGICIGSGMRGVTSMAQMFKDRRDKKRFKMIFSY
jgi:3-oxoacyl-(acyl-carrier-protein) synthase